MFDGIRRRLSKKFPVGRELEIEGDKFEIVQITKRGLALRLINEAQTRTARRNHFDPAGNGIGDPCQSEKVI